MVTLTAKLMVAVTALLFSQHAFAGDMSFGLSMTGSQLTLINQGNGSAFYPAVFRMRSDGGWEPLDTSSAPAELRAGAQLQFTWPDAQAANKEMPEFDRMQPVMVRFFDQSGVGFGQIAFFNAPPASKTLIKAGYVRGILVIESPLDPSSIRATWVLWPQEEGIKPIRLPVRFAHRPPPAVRIDWQRRGGMPFQVATGAGRPAVILLHETAQGYKQQFVPDGGLQGTEQRAAWLDAALQLYAAAVIAFVLAAASMVLQFLRRRRGRIVAADSES